MRTKGVNFLYKFTRKKILDFRSLKDRLKQLKEPSHAQEILFSYHGNNPHPGMGGCSGDIYSFLVTDIFEEDDDSWESWTNESSQDQPGELLPVEIPDYAMGDKFSLWVDGPHLRGANIWQSIVIPDLDGLEFKGSGPVGPPYFQEDFDHLAELGANYVSISGPGLFTEEPPFQVDAGAVANLDHLLAMIAEADMFATIGFRTGPGRSEYNLCCSGDRYFRGYFNDTVWEDQTAQDAWVEMWRFTAERYEQNPIVNVNGCR